MIELWRPKFEPAFPGAQVGWCPEISSPTTGHLPHTLTNRNRPTGCVGTDLELSISIYKNQDSLLKCVGRSCDPGRILCLINPPSATRLTLSLKPQGSLGCEISLNPYGWARRLSKLVLILPLHGNASEGNAMWRQIGLKHFRLNQPQTPAGPGAFQRGRRNLEGDQPTTGMLASWRG